MPIGRVIVGRCTLAGVVVAGVGQAQGVADFVGQGLPAIVVQVRGLVGRVTAVDQVPGSPVVTGPGTRQVGKRSRTVLTAAVVAEGHVAIAAAGLVSEGNIGHVGPGLHGEHGLGFLLSAELAEPGNPVFVHGARRGRGQERVGQFDFAAAVLVLVGRTVAQ
ncbi:hypothetical protein D9M69_425350 [compost metagenome]